MTSVNETDVVERASIQQLANNRTKPAAIADLTLNVHPYNS